jgi:hypothetical protein
MGSYFSTRWGSVSTRQETDPLLFLDVRLMKRIGALQPGAIWHPAWTSRGKTSGSITTITARDGHSVTLDYKTRRLGEEWRPIKETVSLDWTECHLGGMRAWFLCPGCASRRAILYSVGGRFRCRACHKLDPGRCPRAINSAVWTTPPTNGGCLRAARLDDSPQAAWHDLAPLFPAASALA